MQGPTAAVGGPAAGRMRTASGATGPLLMVKAKELSTATLKLREWGLRHSMPGTAAATVITTPCPAANNFVVEDGVLGEDVVRVVGGVLERYVALSDKVRPDVRVAVDTCAHDLGSFLHVNR